MARDNDKTRQEVKVGEEEGWLAPIDGASIFYNFLPLFLFVFFSHSAISSGACTSLAGSQELSLAG